jgi:YD repeat-containing protein
LLGHRIASTAKDHQTGATHTTQFEFNNLGWNTKTIDAVGREFTTTYDGVGNVIKQVENGLRTTTNTYDNVYDQLNRVKDTIDAEGIVTHTKYDEFGEKIAITENDNLAGINTRTTQFKYDKLGRKIQTIDADNHSTYTEYDEANNIRSVTDGNHHTTSYDYDILNRQTKIIDANHILTQLTVYDGFGNVKSIKDSGGNETKYDYDNLNRQTKMTDPHGKTVTQHYDGLSRVDWKIDRNNHRSDFTYNIDDNLLTEQWNHTTQIQYTYDKIGNLKSSYDATSSTTNIYNYDAIYQLTDKTTGNTKFHYDYDAYGDLTKREDWVNSSKIATLDYTYDKNHQLKHLTQTGTGVVTQNLDFTYDKLNQLRKIDRKTANDPGHLITNYQYNKAVERRLIALELAIW